MLTLYEYRQCSFTLINQPQQYVELLTLIFIALATNETQISLPSGLGVTTRWPSGMFSLS